MSHRRALARIIAGAIGIVASGTNAAPTSFWFPIQEGTTLNFIESGRWSNSQGLSGVTGPDLIQVRFAATDRQVFDHHVDLSNDDGHLIMRSESDYLTVADGDPSVSERYEYYIDPSPFIIDDPIEEGDKLSFQGLWRGQWPVPGGGAEPWTGEWTHEFTNLGPDTVTTPLGTFNAVKLGVVETDIKRAATGNSSRSEWSEVRWFDTTHGFVKISGSGINESDYDGDGTTDYWLQEELTWLATPVPEASTWVLLLTGGLLLGVVRRNMKKR